MKHQPASASAWSPNPKKPPLYLDLPVENAEVRQDVIAKWAANAPLAFIDPYIGNLRQYRASRSASATRTGCVDTGKLHDVLDTYGVAHTFEIHHGTDTSAIAYRFQNHVTPCFRENLCYGGNCR